MGTWHTDPTRGVAVLVAAGLPLGPLETVERFYRAPKGGKLHRRDSCGRSGLASTYLRFVDVDPQDTCQRCWRGPTEPTVRRYIRDGHTVVQAHEILIAQRKHVLAEQAGKSVEELTEDETRRAETLTATLPLGDVPWELVNQARAAALALEDVRDGEGSHPALVQHVSPIAAAARAWYDALRAAATCGGDDDELIRRVVLDLMEEVYRGSKLAGTGVPDLVGSAYPALCTVAANYYGMRSAAGFEDLVERAWRTWRTHVQATGSVQDATAAALASTRIDELEPNFMAQVTCLGAPVTEHVAGQTPWQWLTAEWRIRAREELTEVLATWQDRFTDAMRDAAEAGRKIVQLTGWGTLQQTSGSATMQILGCLQMAEQHEKAMALVLAPGPVATWLTAFDLYGVRHPSTNATIVADAREDDTVETLEVALALYQPYGGPSSPLASITAALAAARGVYA